MLYDTVTGISYTYHTIYHIIYIIYHIIFQTISYRISYYIIYYIISYHISYHITPYHLFSFRKSVQDYIIHMGMEIVIFVGIKG